MNLVGELEIHNQVFVYIKILHQRELFRVFFYEITFQSSILTIKLTETSKKLLYDIRCLQR
jgi:hypothetical protein